MIYRLKEKNNALSQLEPVGFLDFEQLQKVEKDLENLIAKNLLNILFEDDALMPIYQERNWQKKADIYAINRKGDLVVFELKRGIVGDDAVHQVLRYTQEAGQWGYDELDRLFKKDNPGQDLSESHKQAFELNRKLLPIEFNRNQHLFVVGNGANEKLAKALDYWKSKGLMIEFIPYRIYKISNELYFEFFSKPYDIHSNPNNLKGVIFDTNRAYSEHSVWEMINKRRVAAYSEQMYFIKYLNLNDIVFLSHKHCGLIAAGKVKSKPKMDGLEEQYVEIEYMTPLPNEIDGIQKYMPFSMVSEILDKSFYWARTVKVPYLSNEESQILLAALNKILKK